MSEDLVKPEVPSVNIPKAIQQCQQRAKHYFYRNTLGLLLLEPGETGRIQQLPYGQHGVRWKLGRVRESINARSYMVEFDGTCYQRNTLFLRKTMDKLKRNNSITYVNFCVPYERIL